MRQSRQSILQVVVGTCIALSVLSSASTGQSPIPMLGPSGERLRLIGVSSDGVGLFAPENPASGTPAISPVAYRFTPGRGLEEVRLGDLQDLSLVAETGFFTKSLTQGGKSGALIVRESASTTGLKLKLVQITPASMPVVPAITVNGTFEQAMISDDGRVIVARRQSNAPFRPTDVVKITSNGTVTGPLSSGLAGTNPLLVGMSNDGRVVLATVQTYRSVTCEVGGGYQTPPSSYQEYYTDSKAVVIKDGRVSIVDPVGPESYATALSGDGKVAFVTRVQEADNPQLCPVPSNMYNQYTCSSRSIKVDISTGTTTQLVLQGDEQFVPQLSDVDGQRLFGYRSTSRPEIFNGVFPPDTVPVNCAIIPEVVFYGWFGQEFSPTITTNLDLTPRVWKGLYNAFNTGVGPLGASFNRDDQVIFGTGPLGCVYVQTLGLDPATGASTSAIWHAVQIDSDGDGLLDAWEDQQGGIDVDLDGQVDLNLYELGARKARKDLFVEIDASPGWMPSQEAVDLWVQAFADAPVQNPDGSTGIRLHVQRDESSLPADVIATATSGPGGITDGFPDAAPTHKQQYFGTAGQRSENWAKVRLAKLKAYRYMLVYGFINRQTDAPFNSAPVNYGGIAELDGNDAIIHAGTTANDQSLAAVMMHEFGHNLGLGHGGGDSVNYKPNHLSIMNYLLAYPTRFSQKFWRLDYSRAACATIDEQSVNERDGIKVNSDDPQRGVYRFFRMPYKKRPSAVAPIRTTNVDGRATDFNGNGSLQTAAAIDLNWFGNGSSAPGGTGVLASEQSPSQSLESFDEWQIIRYRIAPGQTIAEGPSPGSLPTFTVHSTGNEGINAVKAFIEQNVPPPCFADVGSQGGLAEPDDILDNNDFVVFVSLFFDGDVERADIGVQGGVFGSDSQLDNNDFISFINEFFGGC